MTHVRSPLIARVAFVLLAAATLAAFFVTQRLKDSDPIVKRIATPLFVSPNGDGRKDTARVSFQLPKGDRTTVAIVTEGGDEQRRLIDDRELDRGLHVVEWDGRDARGEVLRDGSYFVRVSLRRQGRSVTGPRPIRLETTPPRPRIESAQRLRDGSVRLRYSGPNSPPAQWTVYRTDGERVREVARFLGRRGQNVHVWDGFVGLKRLPPGDYAFAVTVQNKALVAGSWPRKLPPTRASALPGTGVTFTQLNLAPPLEPIRSGTVARVTVGGPSRRFRWKLTRLGSVRPLRRGKGSGHTLAFRVPRDAPTGLYTVVVDGAGHRASAPIAVRAGGGGRRVLVVLPAVAWQGRNAVDGDRDGFDETLDNSRAVGATRAFAGGRPPAGFAERVAPLMRFLGRRDYDLTTDLALARRSGPRMRSYQGVMFVGDERWLPTNLNRGLRSYVEGGGKVASFGTDSFRRRVAVFDEELRDPSRPERTNVFGERVSRSTSEAAPLVEERDGLKLFEGTDGLIGAFEVFEVSDGLVGGARLVTAAGREPGKPAFVGYRLGDGVVVRVGVPGWAAALDSGDEEAKVTKRIWALLSR